jgi:branched-chain amino acid transport system permease protein
MLADIVADTLIGAALLCIASLGLSIVYAIFRFPNFAQADDITAGAYGALAGYAATAPALGDAAGIVAGAIAAIALTTAVVFVAARLVFEPLARRGGGSALVLAAFAVGLLVRNVLALVFGVTERMADRGLEIARPVLFAVRMTTTDIGLVVGALMLVLALHLILRRTNFGRCLRAVAENPQLAAVTGVPVALVRWQAWGLAAFASAAAGLALMLLRPLQPEAGYDFLLPSLAAVILGGLGSIQGTLLGAVLIAAAEAIAVHAGLAAWRQVVSFALILLVLRVRPRGIMGKTA